MGHTDRKPTEAPAGIKTNRKLVRVSQRTQDEIESEIGADASKCRYFDISIHSERSELVKMISWATRNDVELILMPIYVE